MGQLITREMRNKDDSLLPCPVVEEVARFDVSVDDVVGVDVPQCQKQRSHVVSSLRKRHMGEIVLGKVEGIRGKQIGATHCNRT